MTLAHVARAGQEQQLAWIAGSVHHIMLDAAATAELRWKLTADPAEIAALSKVADGCGYAPWPTSPPLKNTEELSAHL
ncbi:hypothetical protein [Streptomyces sp. NPDC050264]|uniref:hypothetical protein n=1 Tax=Streptomyces sp. NPDC050264 TaxID=3155038 RepID=UPI00341ED80B